MTEPQADLWISLPEIFHEIPLYDDENGATSARLRNTAREELTTGASPPEQEALQGSLTIALDALREQGARYWGVALARSANGELSTANLAVMVRHLPSGTARKHLVGTIATVAAGPDRTVALRDLPSGPATVITRETTQPLGAFGDNPNQAVKVRDVQYLLPFPDGRRLAIVELSTMYLPDWNDYLRIMEGIVHSISFTDPTRLAREADESDRIRAIIAGEL